MGNVGKYTIHGSYGSDYLESMFNMYLYITVSRFRTCDIPIIWVSLGDEVKKDAFMLYGVPVLNIVNVLQ